MSVPDFQSLMLPVLVATAEGEIPAAELRNRVSTSLKLTQEDLTEMLPIGRQTTFGNRTAWANVILQRAGLIEKTSRGIYRATPTGLQVLAEVPSKIDMKFLERFPSYVEWRQRSAAEGGFDKPAILDTGALSAEVSATPEEQIDRSYQILTGALEADLLDRMREMSPTSFEGLVIDLLSKLKYGGGLPERGKGGRWTGRRWHRRSNKRRCTRARPRLCPGEAIRGGKFCRTTGGPSLFRQSRWDEHDKGDLDYDGFHLPSCTRICVENCEADHPHRWRGARSSHGRE
jgi:restriction endonuclease Mrr